MEVMGLGSILLLISLIAIIPYTIVVLLKFFLWKFSFTARVIGFFTFSEIMLRVPLHLNFSLLIRIERLSFSFSLTARMLKIHTYGFQIFLLVKNDFNLWKNKKIEILQMLEDIRTTLKRKGQLKQTLSQAANALRKAGMEQSANNPTGIAGQAQQANNLQTGQAVQHGQQPKRFVERMLHKMLTSFEVSLQDTIINFVAYKDEDKKIEEANIKRFYQMYCADYFSYNNN